MAKTVPGIAQGRARSPSRARPRAPSAGRRGASPPSPQPRRRAGRHHAQGEGAGGGRAGHPQRAHHRPQALGLGEESAVVREVEHRRHGLGRPGARRDQGDEQKRGVRQQEHDGEQPAAGGRGPAAATGGDPTPRRRHPPDRAAGEREAAHPGQEPEPGQGHHRQGDRLNPGGQVVAVELRGRDLSGHHPEGAAEDVGRRERGQGGHEGEERRSREGRPEHGQRHPDQGAQPARAEARRRLPVGRVEARQPRAGEEVEVDVHRVGVDQQDRPGPRQAPGGRVEAEEILDRPRDEPGLAVEEEERDHPHQGRQGDRQGDEGAQQAPAGELRALEEERERHAHRRRQAHRRHRDPQAAPQGEPLVRPVGEGREAGQGPAVAVPERLAEGDEERVADQPGESQREERTSPAPKARPRQAASRPPRSKASSWSWVTMTVAIPARRSASGSESRGDFTIGCRARSEC